MPGIRESDDAEILRLDQIQYVVGPLVDGADVENGKMELVMCGAACLGGEGVYLCLGLGCTTMKVLVGFQRSLLYERSR